MVLIRILITFAAFVIGLFYGGIISALVGSILIGSKAFDRAFEVNPLGFPALFFVIFYITCALATALFAWRASANWTRKIRDIGLIDAGSVYSELGGARLPSFYGICIYATWPFAKLLACPQHIELKVMGKHFAFSKNDDICLSKRRGIISTGIEIMNSQREIFIFWSFDANRLIAKVRSLGFDVNEKETKNKGKMRK